MPKLTEAEIKAIKLSTDECKEELTELIMTWINRGDMDQTIAAVLMNCGITMAQFGGIPLKTVIAQTKAIYVAVSKKATN